MMMRLLWNHMRCSSNIVDHLLFHCIIIWDVSLVGETLAGRGGALIEPMPFHRRVVGSNPPLASMSGPWANPSLAVACSVSTCKFRHCQLLWSGALPEGSGCEKRYRNG